MKKTRTLLAAAVLTGSLLTMPAEAASLSHKVVRGDTMWKLAVQYQVGTSEIIQANPQVADPDLIYPGQILQIPQLESTVSSYESEVIRLVNEIRQQNGLRPLAANWELSRVARYKSQDMRDNGYFSHNSPTYGTPFQMLSAFGLSYRTAGENIAKGYASPQAVVNGWMNSSGHRANILNASYTQIGVGYVSGGNYWTQLFIG
ncbi:MAG: SafA/ExsA family spore coat assembly protein [Clostridiaceae bacterium]|nr:SafA/ExsA family spore coat assembly protein [Clostridiaceae bacterium]